MGPTLPRERILRLVLAAPLLALAALLFAAPGALSAAGEGEGGGEGGGGGEDMDRVMREAIIDGAVGRFRFSGYVGDPSTLRLVTELLGEEQARGDFGVEAIYRLDGEMEKEVTARVVRLSAASDLAEKTEGMAYTRPAPATLPRLSPGTFEGSAVLEGKDEKKAATVWAGSRVVVTVTAPAGLDVSPVVRAYLRRYPSVLSRETLDRGYARWRPEEVSRRLAQYREAVSRPAELAGQGFTSRNYAGLFAAVHAEGVEPEVKRTLLAALDEAPTEEDISKNAETALAALRLLGGERLVREKGDVHDEAFRAKVLSAWRRRTAAATPDAVARRLVADLDEFLRDPVLQTYVYTRLEALTGERLGEDPEAWKAWAAEESE